MAVTDFDRVRFVGEKWSGLRSFTQRLGHLVGGVVGRRGALAVLGDPPLQVVPALRIAGRLGLLDRAAVLGDPALHELPGRLAGDAELAADLLELAPWSWASFIP